MHILLAHILHVQWLLAQIRKNEIHKVGTIRRLKLCRIRKLKYIVSVQQHSKPARKIKQNGVEKQKQKKQNKTTVVEASFPPKQVLLKTTNSAAESQELRSPGEGGTIRCAKKSKQLKQAF